MEFNEKLQELRRKKEITQEELAIALYVSRTAISKWESGRGYPNIDSLKAIAKFFGVTIDELLSGDELLTIAEEDNINKKNHFCDLILGLIDISTSMLFVLPFFAQKVNGKISEVSLLQLTENSPYLRVIYFILISTIIVFGILILSLQNFNQIIWMRIKVKISLILNIVATFVFIISLQPYAAIFLFVFLIIKILLVAKK